MRIVFILVLLALAFPVTTLQAATLGTPEVYSRDWAVPGIHFFTQASGPDGKGFPVVDDPEAPLLSAYYALGGDQGAGYPISDRYDLDGRWCQAFQKAIACWNRDSRQMELLNIFDELSYQDKDGWLWDHYRVPRMSYGLSELNDPSSETMWAAQSRLNSDESMKELYFSVDDPLARFGLPTSDIVDAGDYTVLRLQKAVFTRWKKDHPWGDAGTVTVALGGDIARAAGMVPSAALNPVPPEDLLGGERWIDVSLAEQTATAYLGLKPLYVAVVATGVPGWETPKGDWRIFSRVENETMRGIDYYLTGVLFTQYITSWGVALHYNYWTPNEEFGNRAGSHGCVGMRYDDALYFWEFAELGTRVSIHD